MSAVVGQLQPLVDYVRNDLSRTSVSKEQLGAVVVAVREMFPEKLDFCDGKDVVIDIILHGLPEEMVDDYRFNQRKTNKDSVATKEKHKRHANITRRVNNYYLKLLKVAYPRQNRNVDDEIDALDLGQLSLTGGNRYQAMASTAGRPASDLYETPAILTQALVLCFLRPNGLIDETTRIREPCYGYGAIADVIAEIAEPAEISRRDLFTLEGEEKEDFLSSTDFDYDFIITNPPFSLKKEFLLKCIDIGKPFALLLPMQIITTTYFKDAMDGIPFHLLICVGSHKFMMQEGAPRTVGEVCWIVRHPTTITHNNITLVSKSDVRFMQATTRRDNPIPEDIYRVIMQGGITIDPSHIIGEEEEGDDYGAASDSNIEKSGGAPIFIPLAFGNNGNNDNNGDNDDTAEDNPDEFECPVCYETEQHCIMAVSCDHKLCYGCAVRMFEQGQYSCPICRAMMDMDDVRMFCELYMIAGPRGGRRGGQRGRRSCNADASRRSSRLSAGSSSGDNNNNNARNDA